MSPENIVAIATGTAGLTAFLLYLVRFLGLAHVKQDEDVLRRLDRAEARLEETVPALRDIREGLELNADATDRLAKVVGTLVRESKAKP